MISDVQHVCFDKDGTLIDVHASWAQITRRRAEKIIQTYVLPKRLLVDACRIMGVDIDAQRILPGGPVGYKPRVVIMAAVETWLKSLGVTINSDGLAHIFRAVDTDIQTSGDFNVQALPGVAESIKRLNAAGLKISICTSDRHKNAQMVMEQLGIDAYIQAIVGGDDVVKPKPDPEGFQNACSLVGADIRRSVYIGDTVEDMMMARAGGSLGAFGITQGLASREELKVQAHQVFGTMTELTDWLLECR